jgi:asparagine N-glycosylation enzyme membrane subunit Stt3
MNKALPWWAAWLTFSLLTAAIAMLYLSAAFVDGQYIPVGNDSFYHARRIIDAAIGARGFYQFDPWIHVPEGSWLNWPWAYDLVLAYALRLALWICPDMQPMKFLAYVPVAWISVNVGLLTLIFRQVRLPLGFTAIGLLAFALLPLTQNLHGVGLIDHHFIEMTFVLLTVLLGLRFFENQQPYDGILLGIVLGSAVSFHNGLFILQVPILAAVALQWYRSTSVSRDALLWLAGVLVSTTLLAILPSEAAWNGQFEFWTLSWFHLYIAIGSASVLAFFALRPASLPNFGILVVVGIVLISPLLARLLTGAAFLSGELDIIQNITEVQSPVSRWLSPGGSRWVTSAYSWLILLAPLLIVVHALRLLTRREPQSLFLSVFILFGLALMLSQYRLHPFGSWAIVVGSLLAIDQFRKSKDLSVLQASAVTLAVLAIALQPALRNQLFKHAPPGLDQDYAASRSLYPGLAEACESGPGTVLALPDDGHPIRYHTECSVLVNNFLMTPLHTKKLVEKDQLLQMSPAELKRDTNIRYVFVRINNVFVAVDDGLMQTPLDVLRHNTSPLFASLAFSDELPAGFRLIDEVRVPDERDFAYARVFEIVRD